MRASSSAQRWTRRSSGNDSDSDAGAIDRRVTGDLIGETGVITELATGHWQLYTIVLDSDGTVVKAAAERFERAD
jgi:hypothetical protein